MISSKLLSGLAVIVIVGSGCNGSLAAVNEELMAPKLAVVIVDDGSGSGSANAWFSCDVPTAGALNSIGDAVDPGKSVRNDFSVFDSVWVCFSR